LFFPNITINGLKYWDGGLLSNNPIFEVYNEATTEFPGQQIDAIVSIGTGKRTFLNPPSGLFGILNWAVKQLTRTEENHIQFAARYQFGQDVYKRLNGGADLWEIGMDDWQQLGRVEELAIAFISSEEGQSQIDGCARRIARRQ
jgi:predicted acylesterase/phospholipase RssA